MLISLAHAQTAGGSPGGDLMGLLPIILMFVVLYFLMIRPQMKRAKEHKTMLEGLAKGDEVVTAGGVLGRITKLTDAYAVVEVSNNVEIIVQRPAIQLSLPKGTIKGVQQ